MDSSRVNSKALTVMSRKLVWSFFVPFFFFSCCILLFHKRVGVEDVFDVNGHRGGLGSRVYNVDTDKISVLALTRRCIVISSVCLVLFLACPLLSSED